MEIDLLPAEINHSQTKAANQNLNIGKYLKYNGFYISSFFKLLYLLIFLCVSGISAQGDELQPSSLAAGMTIEIDLPHRETSNSKIAIQSPKIGNDLIFL